MATALKPPAPDEYAPFYEDYVRRMRAEDVIAVLPRQIDEIRAALGMLNETQARYRNEPGEWSIKEVMGHMNDVERVFSYRLLRVSRNDPTPLPGFEQDDYVRESGFDTCSLADLIQEFDFLRRANILAIQNMSEASTLRRGTASGSAISARGLIYMLAGHVAHHMESLQTKYLPGLGPA
jgi:hypothetical protein